MQSFDKTNVWLMKTACENTLFRYNITENNLLDGKYIIKGHFEQPNIMSNSIIPMVSLKFNNLYATVTKRATTANIELIPIENDLLLPKNNQTAKPTKKPNNNAGNSS